MKHREVESSTGNVFADLELADAEDLTTRAQLAHRIGEIIRGRHLTQVEAAEVLDATQPIVSRLMRGQLHGFSLERLMRFLNALDRDVEIVVRRRPRGRGHAETRVRVTG
ncbi:MAG TPA: helix-turn-helix transcriptional regulator [Longimicrobiales bacterium]|nr:helix-turn-helix transcriptional regulator [Longimicrobiales bacterium]